MNVSREVLKQNYELQPTSELINLYVNNDLTDLARSVLSECLTARGEQMNILDARKEKQSPYLKEEVKKGSHSMFNFRRRSTWLAFIVGFPLYLYLYISGWKVGFALMLSVLPAWAGFRIIELFMNKRKIASLSNTELTNIVEAKVGELGYESQRIAQEELRRRSSCM